MEMREKMNDFIKIEEGKRTALVDPIGKVCLGVSKQLADNLDSPEVAEKLYPIWKQQMELLKTLSNEHEVINTAYLLVTRQCNMSCDFCAISANEKMCIEKEIRLGDIQNKVVPFFKINKPHKLIISGGEPLIKAHIIEIVKVLHEEVGCQIILQSNGLIITSKLVNEMAGYVNEIDFSTMHMFATPERQTQLTEQIEMCQKAGIQVVLSFIYEKHNEEDLYRLIDIAAKYDINVIFNIVSSVGRAIENSEILTELEHIDMNLKIAKYILEKGYENKKICNGFHQRIQVRDSCGAYGRVMAIYPEGDIYMCQCIENKQVRMGNILIDTPHVISSNWEKLLKTDEIKEMFCVDYKDICKDCEYRYICGGRCVACEETVNFKCVLAKAILNYELFHYNPQNSSRMNLKKYVEYMKSVRENCMLEAKEDKKKTI